VELSNDANASFHVECEYINEEKGRVNFDFELTAKQTVTWDVLTQAEDHVNPPPFPTNTGNPAFRGNALRGELICFATNDGRNFQVAWNELTGTATVLNWNDQDAAESRQAFKYNAWAFAARSATGLAPDNNTVTQGKTGRLVLNGLNSSDVRGGPAPWRRPVGAASVNPSSRIGPFLEFLVQ
jgi:hypothetical protein